MSQCVASGPPALSAPIVFLWGRKIFSRESIGFFWSLLSGEQLWGLQRGTDCFTCWPLMIPSTFASSSMWLLLLFHRLGLSRRVCGGGKRGGTELSCLLGGDKPCKLTKAGKILESGRAMGTSGRKKQTKKQLRMFLTSFYNQYPCSLTNWQTLTLSLSLPLSLPASLFPSLYFSIPVILCNTHKHTFLEQKRTKDQIEKTQP